MIHLQIQPPALEPAAVIAALLDALASDGSDLMTVILPHAQRAVDAARALSLARTASSMNREAAQLMAGLESHSPCPDLVEVPF